MHERGDYSLLALGVLSASTSPPIIAAAAAPALALAFWRTGAAAVLLAPALFAHGVRRASARAWALTLLAGAALAVHFGTFIPSLSYTSVASSAALVCSQAVWAGLLGSLLGERLPRRAWAGVAVCLAGVLLVTGVDVSLSGEALLGDMLALLAGLFGGIYIVTGGFVRRELSTLQYSVVCYGACGLLMLVVCVVSGQALTGYTAADWARIVALTVFGQLLGHSLFNLVLRSISPTIVSLATLFVVPLAAVIAAVTLGQTPPVAAVPALALLLAGTALVISARDRAPAT